MAYEDAYEIAKNLYPAMSQFRLGIALNFAILYQDILGKTDKACELVREVRKIKCDLTYNKSLILLGN